MQLHRKTSVAFASFLLSALLCACVTAGTPKRAPSGGVSKEGWVKASPVLQAQIDDEAKRLPWTHGFERLEQIRWFASVGEPAYETLFRLADDPRNDVAAAALAALGATLDHQLVPFIRALPWSEARATGDLRLERARTLVRLGDWSEIPQLIAGLSDSRTYTRSLCLDALEEATHETLGYDPRSAEDVRQAAVERWELWWQSRSGDGLLTSSR